MPATRRGSPPGVLAVAYSGGRDSLALLHCACRVASALGLQVVALHIHHGLLPQADAWLRQAQQRCRRWQALGWPLSLRWARLQGAPAPGQSIEAWARAGRHAALQRLAGEAGATLLLLAQHRRDQAETVLLQALRGGGPAGLAAMPPAALRHGLVWARPWLAQPRQAIEAYVQRHRLRPVDDPSNNDLNLARNRLRARVWPALSAAFPEAEAALALSARRAHEADAALAELAQMDLATCALASDAAAGTALQVAAWRSLSAARQANALRVWLGRQAGQGAAEALLQRLLLELPGAASSTSGRATRSTGRWPAGGGAELRLYRGLLHWHAMAAAAATAAVEPVALGDQVIDLSQPGHWPVPAWRGRFEVSQDAQGVPADELRHACLRARAGGEQFQRTAGGLPRSLKKQYQAAGVPADQRQGPLLWGAGALLYVPGLGMDARALARPALLRCRVQWRADPC
ncbi:tRNA lysidine(34) synthetase TilS [Aquabacterium sp. OR-4]|uniref:tRNA lysidine(34) synthetase TilS n=1 Tax=Aquabacterium sp. OR-4 TaxID=2978127 RepID=UPI0021B2FA35|nr:tRNA lysidine(34) synthetase TilS [Aquabacterium sp. OR-4]MDT7835290.1 tRNA lysidine(34) synthetase TilS [Aquabacterium sp. OR-4]